MKAHELINTEDKWSRDAFAKDNSGKPVYWHDPNAVQFDLQGALHRAYGGIGSCLHDTYGFIYNTEEMQEHAGLPHYNRMWGWEGCYKFLLKYDL